MLNPGAQQEVECPKEFKMEWIIVGSIILAVVFLIRAIVKKVFE